MIDGLEEMGLPPVGHNMPPEPTLFERVRALVDNCNRWLNERPVIVNAEMAGKAAEFVQQLRLERDALGVASKLERKPHDEALVEIRARYSTPVDLVAISLSAMEAKQRDWLQRERERLAMEEAKRRRLAEDARIEAERARKESEVVNTVDAELAARQAADKAAELQAKADAVAARAQAKGDLSAKAMSLHAYWKARITNENAALKHYAKHPDIRAAALAAVVKVASAQAKLTKDPTKAPPGIQFFKDERAV